MQKTLIAVAAFAAFSAQAQTKWDMPTPYSEGEFHTRNVKAFAEDVKKNTGGALDITVHSNQSLIKHPDTLRAVSTCRSSQPGMTQPGSSTRRRNRYWRRSSRVAA